MKSNIFTIEVAKSEIPVSVENRTLTPAKGDVITIDLNELEFFAGVGDDKELIDSQFEVQPTFSQGGYTSTAAKNVSLVDNILTFTVHNGDDATYGVVTVNISSPRYNVSPFVISLTPQESKAEIVSKTLPGGALNKPYSFQIQAKGSLPVEFSVTSGALPEGITLSESGLLSGTPTARGSSVFTVAAENSLNDTPSTRMYVFDLVTPPVITKNPGHWVAKPGELMQFEIGYTGVDCTLQWQVSTDGGETFSDISLSDNSTATSKFLNQSNMTAEMDYYRYRCVVTNAAGSEVSEAGILRIATGAQILVQPVNQMVRKGEPATMSFEAAVAGDAEYRWEHAFASDAYWYPLDASERYTGEDTNTLYWPEAVNYGSANYLYRGAVRDASDEWVYTDYVSLQVISTMVDINTMTPPLQGGTVGNPYNSYQFEAVVDGVGNAGVVTWSVLDDTLLPPGLSLSSTGILSGTPSKNGTYTFEVQAENEFESISKEVTVVIQGGAPPVITKQPGGDITLTLGDPLELSIEATGSSELTYHWQYSKNGDPEGSWGNWTSTGSFFSGYTTDVITNSAVSGSHNQMVVRCEVRDESYQYTYSDPVKITVVSTMDAVGAIYVDDELLNAENTTNTAGTASFDVATGTLTLNNHSGESIYAAGGYTSGNLTIHLVGTNTIAQTRTVDFYSARTAAIDLYSLSGDLTFTGGGSLSISTTVNGGDIYGIRMNYNNSAGLTLKNEVDISITTDRTALPFDSGLSHGINLGYYTAVSVQDSASLTISSSDAASHAISSGRRMVLSTDGDVSLSSTGGRDVNQYCDLQLQGFGTYTINGPISTAYFNYDKNLFIQTETYDDAVYDTPTSYQIADTKKVFVRQPLYLAEGPINSGYAYIYYEYDLRQNLINSNPIKSWSIVAGELPEGLILDSVTGVISGTFRQATGNYHDFTVRVEDTADNVFEAKRWILTIHNSHFDVQPTAQTGVVGGSVTFTVSAKNSYHPDAPIRYWWFVERPGVPGSSSVAQTTSNTLTLDGLTLQQNNYQYYAYAHALLDYDEETETWGSEPRITLNGNRDHSEKAILTVYDSATALAPQITLQPQANTVVEINEWVTLSVEGKSFDKGTISYQWQKRFGDSAWYSILGATNKTHSLTDDIPEKMYFRCIVTNTNPNSLAQTASTASAVAQVTFYDPEAGATVSGTLTAYDQTALDKVSITLSNAENTYNTTSAAAVSSGSKYTSSYSFDGVAEGVYTMTITMGNGKTYTTAVIVSDTLEDVVKDIILQLLGDVNDNGSVNSVDVLWIRQYMRGDRELNEAQIASGDVNGSGTLNSVDVLWIRQRMQESRDEFYQPITKP